MIWSYASLWWVWMLFAALLGIIEVMIPTQIFLGFSVGAIGVGLGLLLGIPGLSTSMPTMVMVFAALSLVAWLVIRRAVGIRKGQIKVFEHDINED